MQGEFESHELRRVAHSADRISNITLAVGTELTANTVILTLVQERGAAIASAALATLSLANSLIYRKNADNGLQLAAKFENLAHRRRFLRNADRLHPEEHIDA